MTHSSLFAFLCLVCGFHFGGALRIGLAHSGGGTAARDGIQRAIDETINATVAQIDVTLIQVASAVHERGLCQAISDAGDLDVLLDATTTGSSVARVARALSLPTISANMDHSTWDNLSDEERKFLVHVLPPKQLLVRFLVDLVSQYRMTKIRILYDKEHESVVENLKQLLPNGAEFDSLEGLEGESLDARVRKLRKLKKWSLFTFAQVDTINAFADSIYKHDMFRSAYSWYFVTNDKRKVHCSTCLHARLRIVQPSICHLHEYDGAMMKGAAMLPSKVDFYFYYDLTRLALRTILTQFNVTQSGSAIARDCAKLDFDGIPKQSAQTKQVDLASALLDVAGDFHGLYGEFIIASSGRDNDIEQTTRRSFQDITLELHEVEYLSNRRTRTQIGTWYYGEPNGQFLSKAGLQEEGEATGGPTTPAAVGGTVFYVYHHPPFIFVNKTSMNLTGKVEITGFSVDLIQRIKEEYEKGGSDKFEFVIEETHKFFFGLTEGGSGGNEAGFGHKEMPKAGAGKKDADSTETGGGTKWGGLIGLISNAEDADGESSDNDDEEGEGEEGKPRAPKAVKVKMLKATIMPMTITAERAEVVKFSEPFFQTVSLSILMKKPILQYHFFKFITVLEYSVWICITGAFFFTSVLLWVFDRMSPYSYQNNIEKFKNDDEKRLFTLKESLWFCITSLTPQGGGEAPKALSGRLVAATWWLFGFIIIASYTANLAAFLTVSRLEHKIENLHDLSKQYKTKYAPFEGSSTKTYFERMARVEEKFYEVWKDLSLDDELEEDDRAKLAVWDYPVADRFTKIWAQMSEAQFFKSFDEAIYKIKSTVGRDGYALIAETTVIDYAARLHCDLIKVGGEFNPRPNMFAFDPLYPSDKLDKINKIIEQLREDGTIMRLKRKWWYDRVPEKECEEHRKMSNGISLRNVGGVFMVIAVGIIGTFFALYLENWYYEKKKLRDAIKARLNAIQGPAGGAGPKPKGKRRCAIL